MESLVQTIKTKGITNTILKIGININKFHFSTKKTMERFKFIAYLLEKYNAKMTIPIPAVLLEHHHDDFKKIDDRNIEWVMHGYKHVDYTKLNYNECFKQLKKGKDIFQKYGIEIKGFRAPYLRSNDNVLKVISKLGMIYDSSSSVFINVINNNKGNVKNIFNYYNPETKWKIEKKYEVHIIPVILPDDEILVERLRLKDESIGNIWLKVAKICLKKNWIFVIQLHPDRVNICYVGLKMLLDWAQKNQIWLPSLVEIIEEGNIRDGYRGAIAITGDLDIFSIWDYYRIS